MSVSACIFYLYVFLIVALLFLVTEFWVPCHYYLYHADYYDANLLTKVQPRAFTGTLAHILHLSPTGFIWLLQLFKFGWLFLLCSQLLYWVDDLRIALLLCIMFACTSIIYIANFLTGFVDVATEFWLLLAAIMILNCPPEERVISMGLTCVFLFIAVLTHEKSVFGGIVLLTWIVLRFRKLSLLVIIPYICLVSGYLWRMRDKSTFGLSPTGYKYVLMHPWASEGHATPFNIFLIFTSVGTLWIVYGIIVYYYIGKCRTHFRHILFFGVGLLANMAPLLIAVDTQRMVNEIWLPIFICIVDQKYNFNKIVTSVKPWIWYVLCVAQLLIPPFFGGWMLSLALNPYANPFHLLFPKNGSLLIPYIDPHYDSERITGWPFSFWR